jgi:hypothetical protein
VLAGTQLAQIDSLSGIASPGLLGSFVLLAIFPWVAKWFVAQWQAKRVYSGYSRPKQFDRNMVVIGGGAAGLVSAYIAAAVKATAVKEGVKEEALESSEIEPTLHRRNVLLTVSEGDVDAALGSVGKQYLLTGKLSKAAAASVPVMGLAYSTIGPLWDKMRDCCVIAAIYGHDITQEAVQSSILQCVEQMMFEKGEGGGGTAAVAKSVGKKVMARISARSASSAAINSLPLVGAMVNVVIQKTIATELKEVQSVAMVRFQEGAVAIPKEEVTTYGRAIRRRF